MTSVELVVVPRLLLSEPAHQNAGETEVDDLQSSINHRTLPLYVTAFHNDDLRRFIHLHREAAKFVV